MSFVDVGLVKQLNDMAQKVSRRNCKIALGQMFLQLNLRLWKKHCKSGLIKKTESQHLEPDFLIKNQYERKNLIDWNNDKCVICKLLLKIDPIGYDVPNSKMSYGDFFVRYEHKFLRNTYSDVEINHRKFVL